MKKIALNEKDFQIIKGILKEFPYSAVAFGSRTLGTSKTYSDLDICLTDKNPIPLGTLGKIKEAFDQSDLSIVVDIVDRHELPDSFLEELAKHGIKIQ